MSGIDARIGVCDGSDTFVKQHLANYKVPKEIIVLDALPMLPIGNMGKVDKKALKHMFEPG